MVPMPGPVPVAMPVAVPVTPVNVAPVDLLGESKSFLRIGHAGTGAVNRRRRRAGRKDSKAGGCDRSQQNFAHMSSEI